MAMSKKATPNLPASSRMQMPSTPNAKMANKMKETGGMKTAAKSATKKVMAKASKGGKMAKKGY